MKLLNIYVCLIFEEEKSIWHQHFTQTLRQMGHNVFIPESIGLRESWYIYGQGIWGNDHQNNLTEKILNDVKKIHEKIGIDLFFCYLFPFQFQPYLFTELDKLSIPSVYFFCDNFAYPDVAQKYSRYATLNWVPEKNAVSQFAQAKSRFIYLPMAGNPDINYPVNIQETVDISFLGTKNPYRRDVLGKVLQSGLNLKVYGDGWYSNEKHYHSLEENTKNINLQSPTKIQKISSYLKFKQGALWRFLRYGLAPKQRSIWYAKLGLEYDDMFKNIANKEPLNRDEANQVYSFSSVSIGINEQFNALLPEKFVFYSKLRDFEATIAGSCYLTQNTPDLPELYIDGVEIMTYSTTEELIDKAKFLLQNDAFRQQLRKAALKRALSEHTWSHRFNQLFKKLGLC